MSYFPPYIDASGLHMPTYEDRLSDLVSAYRTIFGQDAELTPAVPDYQLLSVFAKSLDDTSALVLSAYNSRNPLYASGQALDLLAVQTGITRLPGEGDAALRARMGRALAARGAGTKDAIEAAVAGAKWVRMAKVYVNDTDSADPNGIPAHNVAAVVYGGSAADVARALWEKTSPGVGTWGSTSGTFTDAAGVSHTMHFSQADAVPVHVYLNLRRLAGIDEAAVTACLTAAVGEYVNGLPIAEPLIIPRLYAVAYNADPELAKTFAVSDAYASREGGTYTRDDVEIGWREKAASAGVNVSFV